MRDDAVSIAMPAAMRFFSQHKRGLTSLLILSMPTLLFFPQLVSFFLPYVVCITGSGQPFFTTNFLILAESKLDFLQFLGSDAAVSVLSTHRC